MKGKRPAGQVNQDREITRNEAGEESSISQKTKLFTENVSTNTSHTKDQFI